MKRKLVMLTSSLLATMSITGCSDGAVNYDGSPVTVVDGYVKNATVTDSTGAVATYDSKGVYIFADSPVYPISSTGGQLEDTDTSFDVNMSVTDGVTTVISPITTFLGTDSTLLTRFAGLGLGISTLDEFSVDYVSTENTNLAKLSQVLYLILKDSTLTSTFKTSVENNSSLTSLDNIFTLAITDINASSSLTAQEIIRMNNMLTAVQDYNGTAASMETSINAYKSNLVTESSTVITHNNISYGTVVSPHTGKTWLDRNIGASQTCTSMTDTNCYGDYFQWGREADGHEKNTSTTTSIKETVITGTSASFYTTGTSYDDWTSADSELTQRAANWAATDGSSVCPTGYRVPTEAEIEAETSDLTGTDAVSNTTDLFSSFLSLPAAGYRFRSNGLVGGDGTIISIPTTTLGISSDSIKTFDTSSSSATIYVNAGGTKSSEIAYATIVRCIKAD